MKWSEFVKKVEEKLQGSDPDIWYIDISYPEELGISIEDVDDHPYLLVRS